MLLRRNTIEKITITLGVKTFEILMKYGSKRKTLRLLVKQRKDRLCKIRESGLPKQTCFERRGLVCLSYLYVTVNVLFQLWSDVTLRFFLKLEIDSLERVILRICCACPRWCFLPGVMLANHANVLNRALKPNFVKRLPVNLNRQIKQRALIDW